jgi:hypothetical protein
MAAMDSLEAVSKESAKVVVCEVRQSVATCEVVARM